MKRHLKKTGVQELLALDANGNMESIDSDLQYPSLAVGGLTLQRVGDVVLVTGVVTLNKSEDRDNDFVITQTIPSYLTGSGALAGTAKSSDYRLTHNRYSGDILVTTSSVSISTTEDVWNDNNFYTVNITGTYRHQ